MGFLQSIFGARSRSLAVIDRLPRDVRWRRVRPRPQPPVRAIWTAGALAGSAGSAAPSHAGEAPAVHITQTVAPFASHPGPPRELTTENIERIDRIFARDSVEAIFAALEADGSDWAKAQVATLKTKSPQTLKVAFRQLRDGARMPSFTDEMRQEYRIAARVVQRHDFLEGVRALIVDKDNAPVWNPPTLGGVTDAMLDEIFAPLPPDEEWSPL